MTRDELRADILDGIARLENTFLWMRMTDTQKSVAKAQAQYWQLAFDADLDKLLSLVQAQPQGMRTGLPVGQDSTPAPVHVVQITLPPIDWAKWLALLAQYGPQIAQIILAILAGQQPAPPVPPPTPAR